MPWPKGRPFSAEHRAKLLPSLDPAAGGRACKGIPKSTPENMRVPKKKTPQATLRPSMFDLHWAAGFLEGEGCFDRVQAQRGVPAARVSASQVRPDLLHRLSALFGGAVYFRENRRNPLSTKGIWTWTAHGGMARGLMMTLYLLLSNYRREQIRHALQGGNYR